MAILTKARTLFAVLSASLFVTTAFLNAQSTSPQGSLPSAQPESPPTLRAVTRLVLLDVVVTNHQGQFVPGLNVGDFTVLEDGKPQKVSAFTVHTVPPTPKQPFPPLQLPQHQYSNFTYVPQQSDRPVTIVLLDMLNTSGQGQQYARKQMIQFLKALPPDRPVALFTLSSKLRMIQGFTGDSAVLVKAATEVLAQSPLLTSPEAQTQQEQITARTLEVMNGPTTEGPSGEPEPTRGYLPSSVPSIGRAIRDALASQDSFQKLERMNLTISALDAMARSVAGYSGRKNLLWLSADFPVAFGPTLNPYSQTGGALNRSTAYDTNNQAHDLRYETPPIEQTSALLAAAQVSVYPIDVSGVINPGTGIDISTSTVNLSNYDVTQQNQNASLRETTAVWDTHEAMSDIARETGGEAFYGTNDLKGALSRSMEEGSNYYTFAYTPSNRDWNGKYRKIEVKTANQTAKLTYRRGYYALSGREYTGDKAAATMAMAMKLSLPECTMMLLKVRVLPPDAAHKTVSIDYAVDARDIAFADGPDQRKLATLDFVATAWDKDLKLMAHQSDTMNTTLRPESYQLVTTRGLPFHQELDLKPGAYTLRVGVLDRGNQKIGTVDVPLTVQ